MTESSNTFAGYDPTLRATPVLVRQPVACLPDPGRFAQQALEALRRRLLLLAQTANRAAHQLRHGDALAARRPVQPRLVLGFEADHSTNRLALD
ncbi:MAG: hypothetical protein ACREVG_01500 [Burkholderiales bacterium]